MPGNVRKKFPSAKEALEALAEAWPGKGKADAARRVLQEAGFSRKAASLLARLLASDGPLSEEDLRRQRDGHLSPEEKERLAEVARRVRDVLQEFALSPALAPLFGELFLPPPSPPPAFPQEAKPLKGTLERGGVFLLQGVPFRERYRIALLLGEALAHLWGLEGVFLGTRSASGAGRLKALLEGRWGGFIARAGALPHLPGEAPSWLLGPGLALTSPFAFGPLDHALRAVLPVPEAPLRLALLLRKVLVLPAPEEDPALFSALLALVRWAQALEVPVILLSPALPGRLWGELLEALSLAPTPLPPLPSLVRLPDEVLPLALLAPLEEREVGVRLEARFPKRGHLLFPSRERAVTVYRGLTRGSALERGTYLRRRTRDGRTVLLLHAGVPLAERRAREEAKEDLLVTTWSGGGEGLEGGTFYLETPSPLALKEALLGAEEVWLRFDEPPRFLPKKLFLYARPHKTPLKVPEDLRGLDPFSDPEVAAWWEEGRNRGSLKVEVPESWPSSHLPPLPLRRGAESLFLLPPEGKEGGAFLLRPVAEKKVRPLWEREWVWGVGRPLPQEVGVF